jgi:hypothetical protein
VGITCNITPDELEAEFNRQKEVLYKQILNAFNTAGLDFVKNAREQGTDHSMGQYEDVTKALRNSIDYYVFYNGEMVSGGISEQASQNKALISDQVKPSGFQLIGIAGMNYASYVESKGYNVISYQADVCLVDLAGYLENLDQIEKGSAASIEDTFIPEDLPANFIVRE